MAAKFSIETTSSFFLVQCLTVILFFTLSCFAADPDPLQDFCVADLTATTSVNGFLCKPASQATSNDFFFDGLMDGASAVNFSGLGIEVRFGEVKNFPGLNTQGLSANRVDFLPGGYIPFHVHPRASEVIYVIKGELLIGFISTTNVLYSKVVKAGGLSVIPRGLVHFIKNVGTEKAVMTGTYNSQQPGTSRLPFNLFASTPTISNDILAKNLQVSEAVIALIKSKFN